MILLLYTSTPTTHMYLASHDGQVEHTYVWESGRSLSKELLGKIEIFLAENHVQLTQLHGIGVFKGPGSFTGLRIGITTANALADSLEIPISGAVGESWIQQCCKNVAAGKSEGSVVPEYGALPHITIARK